MVDKIGFYLGAFDPFHEGHLEVCKLSLEFLDKLYIQPHKSRKLVHIFSLEERMQRISNSIRNLPNVYIRQEQRIVYDHRKDGKYRYQLIKWAQEEINPPGDFFVVMGSDKLHNPMYEIKGELHEFPHIIVRRNKDHIDKKVLEYFPKYIILEGSKNISSTEIRESLKSIS